MGGCPLATVQVMSLRRAVELALDAGRGLAYMHNRKPAPIVHRDLKPANLMISGAISVVSPPFHVNGYSATNTTAALPLIYAWCALGLQELVYTSAVSLCDS